MFQRLTHVQYTQLHVPWAHYTFLHDITYSLYYCGSTVFSLPGFE
nr:C870 [uncultured bacterium]